MTCPHDDALQVGPPARSACYLDLKRLAGLIETQGGQRANLTVEQAAFIGLTETPRSGNGWMTPSESAYPPTPLEMRREWSKEERQTLRVLMSARTARRMQAIAEAR